MRSKRVWRIVAASLVMGVVLWASVLTLSPFLGEDGVRYAALAILVGIGIVSYAVAGQALGAFRISEFRSSLRRS